MPPEGRPHRSGEVLSMAAMRAARAGPARPPVHGRPRLRRGVDTQRVAWRKAGVAAPAGTARQRGRPIEPVAPLHTSPSLNLTTEDEASMKSGPTVPIQSDHQQLS